MKRLQSMILLFCIANWINLYASSTETATQEQESVQLDTPSDTKEDTIMQNAEPDTIIHFFTQDDNHDTDTPSGTYWPADSIIMMHGKLINSASAYIGDTSYSEVTEEKNLLPHQESHYLGYFIHPTSGDTIYLYGIKDKNIANDANEETVVNHDNDDDNEDGEDDDDDE